MRSILIKTGCAVLFLLASISSWAAEGDPGTTSWYKQPWAWIVPVAIFVVLIIAYIMTGEKKPRNYRDQN